LDKIVCKDQKPSNLNNKIKGVLSRIKKIFLQIVSTIVEVVSAIFANIIG